LTPWQGFSLGEDDADASDISSQNVISQIDAVSDDEERQLMELKDYSLSEEDASNYNKRL
jgi:hypothetical protein